MTHLVVKILFFSFLILLVFEVFFHFATPASVVTLKIGATLHKFLLSPAAGQLFSGLKLKMAECPATTKHAKSYKLASERAGTV